MKKHSCKLENDFFALLKFMRQGISSFGIVSLTRNQLHKGGRGLPFPFSEVEKSALILGKNILIGSIYGLRAKTTFSMVKVGWMFSWFTWNSKLEKKNEYETNIEQPSFYFIKTSKLIVNGIAQILARSNIQKIYPYLTLKSSNLKKWSTFAL